MSGGSERYLPQETEEAIGRLRDGLLDLYMARSPVLDILFTAANTARDVQHGLGAIPTGFLVLGSENGVVRASGIVGWTAEIASLKADTANTRARVVFLVTEVPIHA